MPNLRGFLEACRYAAFRVEEAELEAWRERLRGRGVAIEAEIEWPKGGRSVNFRDPAGNSLELATRSVSPW